jgi:hypothetical protein
MTLDSIIPFLIRAKQNTYPSGRAPDGASRPSSHDLSYAEGELRYIDTYLGGFHFIGEEAVWQAGLPVWGMNYYGKMLTKEIPQGFGEFLKAALLRVPIEAPFRGPREWTEADYTYHCTVNGTFAQYDGWEEIRYQGKLIYRLLFHGGEIRA